MTRDHLARALVVAAALASAVVVVRGAQATPQNSQFRTGAETVAVYATALSRFGDMVLNLSRADFEIRDDERPQAITVFESGLQPITAALLVDTSASMTLNLDLAREAAEQFVIRMLPGDKARVGTFSNRIDVSPTFTGNRDELLQSLRHNQSYGNPTMLWDAVNYTMDALEPVTGRRVIMLLTDGMDTFSATRPVDLLQRARAEDLMVYVVQFRSNARANLAELPLSPTPSQFFGADPRAQNSASTATLRELAQQTGGGHFLLGQYDDVNATFTHVMQELHYQYVLGFTPERLDGKTHQLSVRVLRPGVGVRARRSYVAVAQRAPLP